MLRSDFFLARYFGARYFAASGAEALRLDPSQPAPAPPVDVLLRWTPPTARGVVATAILRRLASGGAATEMARLTGGEFLVRGVMPTDRVEFLLAAVYEGGALGPEDEWTRLAVDPLLGTQPRELPAAPTGFGAAQEDGALRFEWDPPTDGITVHYEIRRGAAWAAAVVVGAGIRDHRHIWAWWVSGEQTYHLRAVDALGRYSETGPSVTLDVDSMAYYRDANQWEEDDGWPGTSADVEDDGAGGLVLRAPAADWADEDLDDWGDAMWPWHGARVARGAYETEAHDMGQVEQERIEVDVAGVASEEVYAWDSPHYAGVPWGAYPREDGTGAAFPLGFRGFAATRAWDLTPTTPLGLLVEIDTTLDDPAGAATWVGWRRYVPGNYTCRAFRIRVLFFGDGLRSPVLDRLVLRHRRLNKKDEVVVTDLEPVPGPTAVTFVTPFRAAPTVTWSVSGGDGRRCVIEDITATGCNLRVFDGDDVELFDGDAPGTVTLHILGV